MAGDTDLGAGLDGGELGDAGGRVAAGTFRRVGHVHFDHLRHIHLHDLILDLEEVQVHVGHHEPMLFLRHQAAGDVGLLEGFRVHHDERIAVAIEVLVLLAVEDDLFDVVIGRKALLDDVAAFQVLEFHLPVGAQVAARLLVAVENEPHFVIVKDSLADLHIPHFHRGIAQTPP